MSGHSKPTSRSQGKASSQGRSEAAWASKGWFASSQVRSTSGMSLYSRECRANGSYSRGIVDSARGFHLCSSSRYCDERDGFETSAILECDQHGFLDSDGIALSDSENRRPG